MRICWSSSPGSVSDALVLATNLGIKTVTHPITSAFDALMTELGLSKPTWGGEFVAAENLQSRLRGSILMTTSNAEGRLLLSTGST